MFAHRDPAVFHAFEKLGLDLSPAVYTGGRYSNRFLAWFASNVKAGLKILHLPDYDPLGLTEFLRLYDRIGEAVSLFTPNYLQTLFRSHSKSALLGDVKNHRMLMELRKSNHPSIQHVVALIDESNAGLEQEGLLFGKHTPNPL
jgi:hypothetical protein